MESFGERLRKARKLKNIKQIDLATTLEVTKSTISNWERNSNKPNINQLLKICELLEVPADYLLGYGDESIEQAKAEYKGFKLWDSSYNGVISILAEIYGGAEEKQFGDNQFLYMYFGRDKNGFSLCSDDILDLHEIIKKVIPPIVERIKLTEQERIKYEHRIITAMIEQGVNAGKSVDDLLSVKTQIEEWLNEKQAEQETEDNEQD